MDIIHKLLIICPLVFFGGFLDSIAGGGGIITLPAYYVAGISPHFALGTNKFASTFGTTISAWRFIKNKRVELKSAAVAAVAALIGSSLGASLALVISENFLRVFLIVALPFLCIFIIKNKKMNNESTDKKHSKNKVMVLCAISGFIIGGYDGFFGPGTGTFLIIVFNTVIGFDLLTASGNAKIVNLASNAASLITFLINGNIVFMIGIPAAVFSIMGHYVGSHLAITKGAKIIRPAFVFVLILLLGKITYDLFNR